MKRYLSAALVLAVFFMLSGRSYAEYNFDDLLGNGKSPQWMIITDAADTFGGPGSEALDISGDLLSDPNDAILNVLNGTPTTGTASRNIHTLFIVLAEGYGEFAMNFGSPNMSWDVTGSNLGVNTIVNEYDTPYSAVKTSGGQPSGKTYYSALWRNYSFAIGRERNRNMYDTVIQSFYFNQIPGSTPSQGIPRPMVISNVYNGTARDKPLTVRMTLRDSSGIEGNIIAYNRDTWDMTQNKTTEKSQWVFIPVDDLNTDNMRIDYNLTTEVANNTSIRYAARYPDSTGGAVTPDTWKFDIFRPQGTTNIESSFQLDPASNIAPGLVTVYRRRYNINEQNKTPLHLYAVDPVYPGEYGLTLNHRIIFGKRLGETYTYPASEGRFNLFEVTAYQPRPASRTFYDDIKRVTKSTASEVAPPETQIFSAGSVKREVVRDDVTHYFTIDQNIPSGFRGSSTEGVFPLHITFNIPITMVSDSSWLNTLMKAWRDTGDIASIFANNYDLYLMTTTNGEDNIWNLTQELKDKGRYEELVKVFFDENRGRVTDDNYSGLITVSFIAMLMNGTRDGVRPELSIVSDDSVAQQNSYIIIRDGNNDAKWNMTFFIAPAGWKNNPNYEQTGANGNNTSGNTTSGGGGGGGCAAISPMIAAMLAGILAVFLAVRKKGSRVLILALMLPVMMAGVSFGATTTAELNVRTGAVLNYAVENPSGDVRGKVTFNLPYSFNKLSDALSFASDRDNYVSSNYTDFPSSSFDYVYEGLPEGTPMSPVTVTLMKNITASEFEQINFTVSPYSSLNEVTIRNSSITATSGVRHFVLGGSTNLTLRNIILNGGGVGGGVSATGGTLTLDGVTFTSNSWTGDGGALSITGGNVSITACTFGGTSSTGNTATGNGGAIYASGGNLTISSTNTFSYNSSTNAASTVRGGGAIHASGAIIRATDSVLEFTHNTAAGDGGALLVTGGNVNLGSTCNFTSNASTAGSGGAVSVSSSGSLTITGATFSGNTSVNGGGAISKAGGTVSITGASGASFSNNSSNGNGGAVYSSGSGTLGLGSFAFSTNSSGAQGGAIYISGGEVDLSAVSFTENSADEGGAIYADGGEVEIAGATSFSRNHARSGGGALYLTQNVAAANPLTFTDTARFTGNYTQTGNGGAVYSAGNLNFSGSPVFSSNYATSGSGGAMYLLRTSGTDFTGSGTVSFSSNYSGNGYGGAVYMTGALTFTGSPEFSSNYVTSGDGGAIYIGNDANAILRVNGTSSETEFTENHTRRNGGAMYLSRQGQAVFASSAVFTGNSTENGNGGAVWADTITRLRSGGTLSFNDNIASHDTSIEGITSDMAGNGGAVFIGGTAAVTLTSNYRFGGDMGNSASMNGGAVCTATANITVRGLNITDPNTAGRSGGFVSAGIGSNDNTDLNAQITVENSTIRNQNASQGGAVRARNVTVTSSDFYENHSTSTTATDGGGAIFSSGTVTLNEVKFYSNDAQYRGGAVRCAILNASNTYFRNNRSGNGGNAVNITGSGAIYSSISTSTFDSNRPVLASGAGGAMYAVGNVSMDMCYFYGNISASDGGAIMYSQHGVSQNLGVFRIASSFFEQNTSGRHGGALYLDVNLAEISSCTFNANRGGRGSFGGGLYLNNSERAQGAGDSTVYNSTFTANSMPDGFGGGLHIAGNVTMAGCTFSLSNTTMGNGDGGGVYVSSGSTLNISATILVGNNANRGADIWSENGTINSQGYNRIGTYGTGGSNTSWVNDVGGDGDRESLSSTLSPWDTATFFGYGAALADNRVPGDSSKPPTTGYVHTKMLQTLMLSEDAGLPYTDCATNAIPYEQRRYYYAIQYDERGRNRWPSEMDIDIGACFNDNAERTRRRLSGDVSYAIDSIEMSGIPNNFRRLGQTASLVARVNYTNHRWAFGGNATGQEPVVWGTEPAGTSVLKYDQNGNYTVTGYGTAYITVRTAAVKNDGTYAVARAAVIAEDTDTGILNLSSVSFKNYFRDYVNTIVNEYQMSVSFLDADSTAVTSSTFQSAFSGIWSTSASQVTSFGSSEPTFSTSSSYSNTGITSAKNGGVKIILNGREKGDLLPMTYYWTFTGDELKAILSYDMSDSRMNDLESDTAYNALFSTLRLDFEGVNGKYPVIGTGGVSASDARMYEALKLSKADGGRGLSIELNAFLANVSSGANAGPQMVRSSGSRLLVVPDGSDSDNAISGTMWAARRTTANAPAYGNDGGSSDGGGGGGGGCSSLGALLGISAALIFWQKRR